MFDLLFNYEEGNEISNCFIFENIKNYLKKMFIMKYEWLLIYKKQPKAWN